MKNFILCAVLSLISSSAFANDCLFGRCSQAVKKTSVKAVDVTKVVVAAPIKATRNLASNIQRRQSYRRYR